MFLAVTAAISLLALSEYNNLTALHPRDRWFDLAAACSALAVFVSIYWCGRGAVPMVLAATVFVLFVLGLFRGRPPGDLFTDVGTRTLGVLYIALPFSYLIPLRGLDHGRWWVLFLIVVIWANDTLAYFTGRLVGRHKLSPVVSPNKTIEGAVGGIIGGVAAALIMNRYMDLGLGPFAAAALAVVLGLVAMGGDLVESVIKRGAGAKDSGTIIPGHGGMLDRIDSIIFPIPVLYYFLLLQARI